MSIRDWFLSFYKEIYPDEKVYYPQYLDPEMLKEFFRTNPSYEDFVSTFGFNSISPLVWYDIFKHIYGESS